MIYIFSNQEKTLSPPLPKRIFYSYQQKVGYDLIIFGTHWKHVGSKYRACWNHVPSILGDVCNHVRSILLA
jgi:hypothetical protein